MKNFKQFLLQERLNINLEVLNLSEYIYDIILKQGKILQEHDKIKNNFCKENNIKLLRIKYNENIIEKLNNNL